MLLARKTDVLLYKVVVLSLAVPLLIGGKDYVEVIGDFQKKGFGLVSVLKPGIL